LGFLPTRSYLFDLQAFHASFGRLMGAKPTTVMRPCPVPFEQAQHEVALTGSDNRLKCQYDLPQFTCSRIRGIFS
jgi:hypothetical protein